MTGTSFPQEMKCRFFCEPMSIALSATIYPSRALMWMVLCMCALTDVSCLYVLARQNVATDLATAIMLAWGLLSLLLFMIFFRKRQSARIEIAESGQIILRILAPDGLVRLSKLVQLSEKSSLWPHLLLLHFDSGDGASFVFPVLRDSVSSATFRPLSVALQWIAVHVAHQGIRHTDISSGNF